MGGAATEVTASTTDLVVEAARFAPVSIARTARRHRLPSEASRRFERAVDPALAPGGRRGGGAAARRAGRGDRRRRHRRGRAAAGARAGRARPRAARAAWPAGRTTRRWCAARLVDVGCEVQADGDALARRAAVLAARPHRADRPGRGGRAARGLRHRPVRAADRAGRARAHAGAGPAPHRVAGARGDRPARGDQPAVRLAGAAARRSGGGPRRPAPAQPAVGGRGAAAPAAAAGPGRPRWRATCRGACPTWRCSRPGWCSTARVSRVEAPGVDGRPTAAQLAELDAALPEQPRHVGVVLCGSRAGRPVDWADAVEALLALGRGLGLELTLRACGRGRLAPRPLRRGAARRRPASAWPASCTRGSWPRPGCPPAPAPRRRTSTCSSPRRPPAGPCVRRTSPPYPPASVDVALVVDEATAAADVEAALREGAGPLLEGLRLFDVYRGPQVGEGRRSLAYALRLRAADRTLQDADVLGPRRGGEPAGARCGPARRRRRRGPVRPVERVSRAARRSAQGRAAVCGDFLSGRAARVAGCRNAPAVCH